MSGGYPEIRLRRLRQSASIRRMIVPAPPALGKMIWPVFVVAGEGRCEPIQSLPEQSRLSPDRLIEAVEPLVKAGLGGVMVFGVIPDDQKDADGRIAADSDGPVVKAITQLKQQYASLTVFSDVCLCGYSQSGHCGPLRNGRIDNDAALPLLADMACVHAAAGSDGVAPSAMMDGQVKAIRGALDSQGNSDTLIMSYSTKFASACYGPFRDAAASSPALGDRRGYQLDPADARGALRESLLDEAEGADILMVKPAMYYLDILARIRQATELPLAAYQVSGSYSMMHALANQGGGDRYALARESLTAMNRAGADILITYWANQYERIYGG